MMSEKKHNMSTVCDSSSICQIHFTYQTRTRFYYKKCLINKFIETNTV